jgi:hypothetical protein
MTKFHFHATNYDWPPWRANVVNKNDSIVLILPFQQVVGTKAQLKAYGSVATMC